MIEIGYSLIGCSINCSENQFSFLHPIFQKGNSYFSSYINEITNCIEEFYLINNDLSEIYIPVMDKKIKNRLFNIGDKGIFCFSYDYEYFIGDIKEVSKQLLMNLEYKQLTLLEKYDIFSFWGIKKLIIKNLELYISEFKETKSIELFVSNFYIPRDIEISFGQIPIIFEHYSEVIENNYGILKIADLFNYNKNDNYIYFTRFKIPKVCIIPETFIQLLNSRNTIQYKDLLVYLFCYNNQIDVAELDNRYLRVEKLLDFSPIETNNEKVFSNFEILRRNSQSKFCQSSENFVFSSWEIEKEIEEGNDLVRYSSSNSETMEVCNTIIQIYS